MRCHHQTKAQRAGREQQRNDAKACDQNSAERARWKPPKSLQIAGLDDAVRHDAAEDENRAGGTRTHNQQIMS